MSSNPDPPPPAQQASQTSVAMSETEREAYFEQTVMQQKAELEQLMDERRKLLSMQNELQRLHDSMPQYAPPHQQQQQQQQHPQQV